MRIFRFVSVKSLVICKRLGVYYQRLARQALIVVAQEKCREMVEADTQMQLSEFADGSLAPGQLVGVEPAVAEPILAKPGAGLPVVEWAVAKFILLPWQFRVADKRKSLILFREESNIVLSLARRLSTEELSARRLIDRLPGLEDSSRFWSVAMVLEHLTITGRLMGRLAKDLSSGGTELEPAGIAQFKPSPGLNPLESIANFEAMVDTFIADITVADVDAFPDAKFPHPWFGPLNSRQWLSFGWIHGRIHRRQVEAIFTKLKS